MVHGLKTTLPSPSQLLRDLDSCNSDPVAVASCFVERVRTAGSWHICLARDLSPGEVLGEYQGHLGWRWGVLGGWHVRDGWVQR